MDLRSARAARDAGDYDQALRLFACVPAFDRKTEAFECLQELTISRRVVDGLMGELNWERARYRGFAHLDESALRQSNTAGLRKAFMDLRVSGVDTALARASMADELVDRHEAPDEALKDLGDLGLPIAGGVRLAVARAYERAGRSDAALDHLRSAVAEAPLQVAGWTALTTALLASGRVDEAMRYGYVATQLRRSRPDLYAGDEFPVIQYCCYKIFFGGRAFEKGLFQDDVFVAIRISKSRLAYSDDQPVGSGNSASPTQRTSQIRYQRLRRRFRMLFDRSWLRWVIALRRWVRGVAISGDFVELIAMLDRRIFRRQKQRF